MRELHLNEIGRVTLSLSQPVACETYGDSRELGGFILVDRLTRDTVGAGMVTDAARRRGPNIYWHQLDVDKAARAALNVQKPVGAVVHRAVRRGQVHHRQPGGKAAARAGPPYHDAGRRMLAMKQVGGGQAGHAGSHDRDVHRLFLRTFFSLGSR